MRTRAKLGVNFFTRVDAETDERRRRLQQRTGYSAPRLVDEALREFEANLDGNMDRSASEPPAEGTTRPDEALRSHF